MPIHYEDGKFVRLNREIIQAAGGNWKNPPPTERIRQEASKRAEDIASLIATYPHEMWGWKDPRQALTVSSYLPYLQGDVYLIAIFRKPEKAGKSLERLGQVRVGCGADLAREYDRRIIEVIKEFAGI